MCKPQRARAGYWEAPSKGHSLRRRYPQRSYYWGIVRARHKGGGTWWGANIAFMVGRALKVPRAKRLARELCCVVKARRGVTVWINKNVPASGLKLPADLILQGLRRSCLLALLMIPRIQTSDKSSSSSVPRRRLNWHGERAPIVGKASVRYLTTKDSALASSSDDKLTLVILET